MGALPGEDALVNQGQLCVKGRFAAYELLNNPDRLRHPTHLRNGFSQKLNWEAAIDLAAEKLAACPPEQFAMRVSLDCTTEDLYIAHKFVRDVMHSTAISTRAPEFYGQGLGPLAALMHNSAPFASLKKADAVLSIGLDGRYGWSVLTVELRRAVRHGARLVTLFPREHSLSSFAEKWLPLDGPALAGTLLSLVRLTAGQNSGENLALLQEVDPELASIARMLVEAEAPVMIVGPEYLADSSSALVLEAAARLARQVGTGVLPLAPQSNLAGALKMLPNPQPLPYREGEAKDGRGESPLPDSGGVGLLYLVGETPSPDDPAAGFLIYQNFASYTGPRQPDLALPAAAFAEVDGTTINLEGRICQVRKAVEPPGEALPDWLIMCRIAQKMGVSGFDYPDAAAIQREIAQTNEAHHRATENTEEELDKEILVPTRRGMPGDAYRGFPLTTWVEGLRLLTPES